MSRADNLFSNIPAALDQELFTTLATGNGVRIERIVSRGQHSAENDWYDQQQDEWVAVLRGGAVIGYEDGSTITLGEGDYLHIPARCRHRVEWTQPDCDTVWLAVHFTAGGGL